MYKVRVFYDFTPLNGSKSICKRKFTDYTFESVIPILSWLSQSLFSLFDERNYDLWKRIIVYKFSDSNYCKRILDISFYDE